jgi:chemotaxis protein histidine kinase CheA
MNQQMGLTEFFAMEAGEYLERLDGLVSAAVGPDRDEFVRLARALRGSALMANQQTIGAVAAALEGLARAVKEERVEWNEATRQRTIGAVDGLKILVRNAANWSDRDKTRAEQHGGIGRGIGAARPGTSYDPRALHRLRYPSIRGA